MYSSPAVSRSAISCQDCKPQTATIEKECRSAKAPSPLVRWLLVPVRVLLVSFLLALLSFAVCLFLGIFGLLISAGVRGVHPNMTIAYREIAFPAAVVAGVIALLVAIVLSSSRRKIGAEGASVLAVRLSELSPRAMRTSSGVRPRWRC